MSFIQTKITDYFNIIEKNNNNNIDNNNNNNIIIYGYNSITDNWHCIECGENMGPNNPRQLCRKTYCGNTIFNS